MKTWIVSILLLEGRWMTCGRFRSHTAAGAISQLVRDANDFPAFTAVKADAVKAEQAQVL